MSKVNKAYSLDLRTVKILEDYCSASDNWDKKISRSKVVNDAIVWYLSGDVSELKQERDDLHKQWLKLVNDRHNSTVSVPTSRPWWRRLLLGQ